MFKSIITFLAVISLPVFLFAATIHVPADYANIQAGINAAADGDTVLIADGTYTGNGNRYISFNGKAMVVKSENGADNCIVDVQNYDHGFYIYSGVSETSVIEGITVKNACSGGICIMGSSPTISHCIVKNNVCSGFSLNAANPTIRECVIAYNTNSYGGGITMTNSNPVIENCTIHLNTASSHGGAMFVNNSSPVIRNCIFNENAVSG